MNAVLSTQRKNIPRIYLLASLMLTLVPQAFAQEMASCPMTLDSLPMCITRHWELGEISNRGIYESLLAKANEAIAARDRGQIKAAINVLNAFIDQVSALAGKQITASAAEHMILHALTAIQALQQGFLTHVEWPRQGCG